MLPWQNIRLQSLPAPPLVPLRPFPANPVFLNSDRIRPNPGRIRPFFGQIWPNSGLIHSYCWSSRPNPGRILPNPGRIRIRILF